MSIQAMVMHTVRGYVDSAKRSAVGYGVCALCGLAVLILATGAGVMALIPVVGAVYAQLIVAGVFLAVIVMTMVWLQHPVRAAERVQSVPVNATAETAQRQAQFAQLAMIIEAVMLGYSMSRRRR